MTMRWTDRWGPLTGVAGIALVIAGFLIAGSTPDTNDPDAKITSYFSVHSHQTKNIVGFFVLLLGILCLLSFVAALRSRLTVAEGGVGRFGALAFAGGLASVMALVTAIAFFVSIAFVADDTKKFHIDPNLYRLMSDTGYEFWVLSGVAGALMVWATMVVAFRTGILPRWFAWTSLVVGIIALFTLFFFPMFIYWLWIIVASLLLVRSAPVVVPPVAPPPAAPPPVV